MALGGARLPPRRPVPAQAAVTGLRAFVGAEKRDLDLVFFQDVSHQRRHAHVTGIQCQIDRLAGLALGIETAFSPGRTGASNYEKYSG